MNLSTVPIEIGDRINARILAVSEDRIQGFQRHPLEEIARQASVELPVVIERIQAMLRSGTIRRVRQTLLATNLAQGALVAWQVPTERLDAAFDYMFQQDPFSGHVVTRSTDAATAGSNFRLMPAKRLFALGVGHTRRRGMAPGSKSDELAEVLEVALTTLNELEWRI